MTNFLKSHGAILLANGFDIVPIAKGEKFPKYKGWQKTEADEEMLEYWLKSSKNQGVGILTKHFPAIDIDVRDEEVVEKLVEHVDAYFGLPYEETHIRVGEAPKCLIAFRTDEPFKKVSSNKYVDLFGDEHQIEILGEGQQYVAFAVHPSTGKPYEWTNGASLEFIEGRNLPSLNREQALEFIEFFESIVPDEWELKNEGDTKAGELAADLSLDEDERILLNYAPPLDIAPKKARRELKKVDPTDFDYDAWLKVGMAIYHQFEGSSEGFDAWVEWSERSAKHNDGDMQLKYDSFGTDLSRTNPVTFAYVLKLAKEATKAKQTESHAGFKLIHASDVLAKLGPINWQVKNYIEADTTGILFGDPGSFKSFLALDLGLHCAAGKPWHDNEVKQGSVIYVAGEGHGGFARRLSAWEKQHEVNVSDLPMYFSQQAAALYDEESANIVTEAIDGIVELTSPPAMIVIDTLARNFGAGDENSTADMNVFVDNVDKLLRAKYQCTVLIVHHTGHANKERARGSMALKGALDYEYRLEKQFDMVVKLTCTKMKDAIEPPPAWFEGESVIVGYDEDEFEEMNSLAFKKIDAPVEAEIALKGKQKECYELLKSTCPDGEGLAKKAVQQALIDAEISKTNDAARKLVNQLLEKEFFVENEGLIYVSDDF